MNYLIFLIFILFCSLKSFFQSDDLFILLRFGPRAHKGTLTRVRCPTTSKMGYDIFLILTPSRRRLCSISSH